TNRIAEWSDRPTITRTRRGEIIQPRTFRQKQYVQMIAKHDLTFGIGPAGTGKTYLAAVAAVKALQNNEVERLILTRPAVEAGEKLGFLPGDLQQKISPYLRPLYDALYELMDAEKIPQLMERGIIEVAPLAYMRGRTLNNAFIIVDEAQNTTPAQMKMVLTRLGFKSHMVVTGDITQIDLPPMQKSGLVMAKELLQHVDGIAFAMFDKSDVVRHPLVRRIVAAYEKAEE
ncbi:MAG: PhoH family protein, partial [Pseudanabaena sp. SU_2_4]|nr:PhoH family protein [Pseudanabaena sp. SU_2_4]